MAFSCASVDRCSVSGLIEFLLARRAGGEQLLGALGLLARERGVGFAGRPHGFEVRHHRLLRRASISNSTVPGATRSPDFTSIA